MKFSKRTIVFCATIALSIQLLAADVYRAKITHYCSCRKCCGWEYKNGAPVFKGTSKPKTIGQTASGVIAREGLTLAAPRSIPFGSHIYLPSGNLLGVVEDRGGAIIKTDEYVKIDVYVNNHQKALELGVYETFIYIRSKNGAN